MKRYKIEIKETLARIEEVEADTPEQAMRMVRQMYDNEEIVLDAADMVGVDYIMEQ